MQNGACRQERRCKVVVNVIDVPVEAELGAGEAYEVEPGHDAWVVGDEPFVAVELLGAEKYAKAQ